MADRLWRAMVTIPRDTLLPEDTVVNTWYFDDDDDPVAAPSDTGGWIKDKLQTFYSAIDQYLSPVIASPATLKCYDMADPEPRVPVYTDTIALAPGAGSGLPEEVALCLSFSADVASGENPRRRRGRIYLGPLDSGNGIITAGAFRPASSMLTTIANAASALRAGFAHPASPGYFLRWSIYSPTTAAVAPLGEAFNDVDHGWVDNAYDTQRRRGPAPTSRTNWS